MDSKRILETLLDHFDTNVRGEAIAYDEFEEQVAYLADDLADLEGLRLAFECLRSEPRAIAELKALLESTARTLGRGLMRDEDFRAEVCQQTFVLLLFGGPRCARGYLMTYGGRAPLRAWLRTALMREGLAEVRRREREQGLDESAHTLCDECPKDNPEQELLKQTYAFNFGEAFRRSLAALSAREKLVLHHHLVENLTAEQIGRRFSVHRVTVARWMRNIRQALFEQTRANLDGGFWKEGEDLTAIFSLVESNIYLAPEALRSEGLGDRLMPTRLAG